MEGVDICWVEEAQTVSENSWQVLIPTIRKEGAEIWVSFNPDQETDPTYRRFVTYPPPGCVTIEVGWRDNPWISQRSLRDKDHSYATDPEAAAHIWGGKTLTYTKAQVLFGKWVVEPFEVGADWDGPYQGADWGFSQDPSTLVRCWISEEPDTDPPLRTLYISHEVYDVGIEITDLPARFDEIPNARKYVTRADSARPDTISHMQQNGYPEMVAAAKGPGSVEDGVTHLRGYHRIVIHPRCPHAIDEARLWSYKRDRLSGDVLPILIDKHNHIWDPVRYALEPIIKHQYTEIDPLAMGGLEQRNPWRV